MKNLSISHPVGLMCRYYLFESNDEIYDEQLEHLFTLIFCSVVKAYDRIWTTK